MRLCTSIPVAGPQLQLASNLEEALSIPLVLLSVKKTVVFDPTVALSVEVSHGSLRLRGTSGTNEMNAFEIKQTTAVQTMGSFVQ